MLKTKITSLYELLTEKLYPHLLEIDEEANERMDILMPQLMKMAGGSRLVVFSEYGGCFFC